MAVAILLTLKDAKTDFATLLHKSFATFASTK